MAWLLVVLLHLTTPAQAVSLCDEVRLELDYAVRRELFPEKAAKALYLRCLKYQQRNDRQVPQTNDESARVHHP